MTFQSGPLVLPCGESFQGNDIAAWEHYISCPECERKHKARGFYSIEAQSLRVKKKSRRNP